MITDLWNQKIHIQLRNCYFSKNVLSSDEQLWGDGEMDLSRGLHPVAAEQNQTHCSRGKRSLLMKHFET